VTSNPAQSLENSRDGLPDVKDRNAPLYFPALDGLRFFAFLLVFFRHAQQLPTDYGSFLKNFGWMGVDLFFVLTGFLFFTMLRREYENSGGVINYKKFYLRRVLRIMPLYFLYIAVITAMAVHAGDPEPFAKFLALATFTFNLLWAFDGKQWGMENGGHLWTIGYEEQMYLFLPLVVVAILHAKRTWISVVALLLVAAAGTLLHYLAIRYRLTQGNGTYLVPIFRPETLIAGILCGIAWTTNAYRKLPSWAYGTIAFAVLSSMFVMSNEYGYRIFHVSSSLITYPVLALLFGSTLLYVLSPGSWLGRLLTVQPLPWLGKISYGLYIWHLIVRPFVFVWVIRPLHLPRTFGVLIPVTLAFVIAVAAISYYLYERPFIRLKERFQVIHNRPV